MFGVEKIKKSFGDVLKEHPYSIALFFISTVLWAVPLNGKLGAVLDCVRILCMGVSLGVLLCESIGICRGENGVKGKIRITNLLIILGSLGVSFQYWLLNIFMGLKDFFGSDYGLYKELSSNILICSMTLIAGTTVFFFYKRSEGSFEEYAARAFCGLMKAELAYGIIALGALLILLIFDVLIYDIEKFDLIERSQILILGLVEFPCVIAGLSKVQEKISKFEKAVLSYVLPALLSLGFVIIYIYIIKILVTWKFPSNEVFSILTALFVLGVIIWTMAFGCCDDNLKKFIKILPIFFIPFIVLQVMCLYMRVADYGFTVNRYFGAALIVFEIAYFILYICKLIKDKDIMAGVIFMAISASILILLFPGTNMYSVITNSQKTKIVKFFAMDDPGYKDEMSASEAYREINDNGGFSGKSFLTKVLTKEQLSYIENLDPSNVKSEDFYIYVTRELSEIDISGHSKLYVINNNFTEEEGKIAADKIYLSYGDNTAVTAVADMSDIMKSLIENEKNDAPENENNKVLDQVITLSNGSKLLITYLNAWGTSTDSDNISYLNIEGYILE